MIKAKRELYVRANPHRPIDYFVSFLWSAKYLKIPIISPGAYIFQRPFLRGLFLEGLLFGLGGLYMEGLIDGGAYFRNFTVYLSPRNVGISFKHII